MWLVFRYMPLSYMMSRCPLSEAQYVQAKVRCFIPSNHKPFQENPTATDSSSQ